jgi:hypothetical protein
MPDLMLRGERNARERLPHYRKATRHEVPLDFEGKTPTETQIRTRRRRFSAAC